MKNSPHVYTWLAIGCYVYHHTPFPCVRCATLNYHEHLAILTLLYYLSTWPNKHIILTIFILNARLHCSLTGHPNNNKGAGGLLPYTRTL